MEAPLGRNRVPRVLVVDDDGNVREMLADLLEIWGYEVDVAVDGTEGVTRFGREPYDLVLTDFRMPGASGLELVEAVRQADPTVGIIMLTASIEDLEDQRRRFGFALLRKPLQIGDLRAAVTHALGPGAATPA